jgi:uncharacterized membrane-anchored protein YhcB (DUF1043 family)
MESIVSLGIWLIPIIAIIMGGVTGIIKMILNHQERIAKIERGMDPDAPQVQQVQQR